MPQYNASNAQCLIFTFKEGLLSKIAHDLKIQATSFQVDVTDDHSAIKVEVDAHSLEVACCMKNGQEAPGTLSAKDKKKIQGNIVKDVLHSARYPKITFASTKIQESGDGWTVQGGLTLHGQTRALTAQVRKEGSMYVSEINLHQPDYGIKPYSAMMGTLKVQPNLKVKLQIPAA